jgi:general nucleoside transport system ATP-binding protein
MRRDAAPGPPTPTGAGASGSAILELRRITKRFPGVVADDAVDLVVRRGEIHALVGENGAGKSTLMRIVAGLYPPDAGEILLDGTPTRLSSPREAIARGIGMVHQHFVLVERFTVTENVVLGAEGGPILRQRDAARRIGELARASGFVVDPSAPVESLSVGERQRVEILKALYRGVDILVLDEPTAVLTPPEARELFANLRALRSAGTAIVFISHKLDEVLAVADRITVLRRGRVVGETAPRETRREELAEMMIGRPVLFELERDAVPLGPPVLEISGLEVGGRLHGVDLTLHAGEVLGIAGVEGNGQRELVECCVGLRTPDAGSVRVGGIDLAHATVDRHRSEGVAFIPEDRHSQGLVLEMTVWENSALGRQKARGFSSRLGVLSIGRIKARCMRLIRRFDVRTRTISAPASTLSGGNQQKLILARELDQAPRVLVAHQPTRGLDVGAIESVWRRLLDGRADGRAVLLVSAELDEILELSDRIVTIYEGRITGEFRPDVEAAR